MLTATKLTMAAALFVGSCGLAMAQAGGAGGTGGAGGDRQPSTGAHPAGNPTSPTSGSAAAPAMQQKNTGMQTPNAATGQETGTAPDSAGPGAIRKAPGSGNETK